LAADHVGGRARALLVFSEVAFAFLVVTGAGLMVRTYQQMISMDLGLRSDHVLTLRIALPEMKYRGSTAVANFFRELLRRVHSVPSIGDAAAISLPPKTYAADVDRVQRRRNRSSSLGDQSATKR
jgi:hypothetical protein